MKVMLEEAKDPLMLPRPSGGLRRGTVVTGQRDEWPAVQRPASRSTVRAQPPLQPTSEPAVVNPALPAAVQTASTPSPSTPVPPAAPQGQVAGGGNAASPGAGAAMPSAGDWAAIIAMQQHLLEMQMNKEQGDLGTLDEVKQSKDPALGFNVEGLPI